MKKLIDAYPYRVRNGKPEFLILKRSEKKIYANQWRMVGGKVKDGEKYFEAALREIKEETGLKPVKFWTVPSVNRFYEAATDCIYTIPGFAAEVDYDAHPDLDDEHSGYKWVHINAVASYIKWPEQRRLMNLIHEILTVQSFEILPEWLIDLS